MRTTTLMYRRTSRFIGRPTACRRRASRNITRLGRRKNYPQGNSAWGTDSDLAVEMISASCPNCTIDLVEANSSSVSDLEQAESEAVALGAHVVSTGSPVPASIDRTSTTKASSISRLRATAGTVRFPSRPRSPASSPWAARRSRAVAAAAADGPKGALAGGGCTTFPKPSWQHDKTCANRLANDVAADAGPSPGIAEYDSYGAPGWIVVGGTSVPTAFLAGVFGLAGNANKQDGGRTFWRTTHHQFLYRLQSGKKSVRYSTGGGWGSPDGTGAFNPSTAARCALRSG